MVQCRPRSPSESPQQDTRQQRESDAQKQEQELRPEDVRIYGRTHRGRYRYRHRIHRRRCSCPRRRRRARSHRRHRRVAFPPSPERQPKQVMGSRCAKLGTGHGRGHESSMKKLVACVSQDNFSLSSESEEEEEGEGVEEEEELPVQGKLLLMEPERQEEGAEDDAVVQQGPKPEQTHS